VIIKLKRKEERERWKRRKQQKRPEEGQQNLFLCRLSLVPDLKSFWRVEKDGFWDI
jgi:hypothetical protein